MSTVAPARRTFGSLAYYLDLLGPTAPGETMVLTLIDQVANDLVISDRDRLTHIRSLLAAAQLLRGEQGAAR
jgi:hypothetical protein